MLAKVSEQIAECLRRAVEFHERAEQTVDGERRGFLLGMERRWLALARSYEFERRLAEFTAEIKRHIAVFTPPHPDIPQVTCPECGKLMRLRSIEPNMDVQPADVARFDCFCGFTYTHTIGRN
jgi:hypothetical protein